jgi:hypothetical protein
MTDEELKLQRRNRSRVTGILLIAFVVLVFAISIVKMGIASS